MLVLVAALVALGASGVTRPRPVVGARAGVTSGDRPLLAPSALLAAISSVPRSLVDSIGANGERSVLTVTKDQPPLAAGGKLRLVYVGAEYCPWCALMRWPLVMALSRFGTFSGLKVTSSAANDGDLPTLSFLGAHFTSRYLVFTPYEAADRDGAPLQAVPAAVSSLYARYDGTGDEPTVFTGGPSPGIPFLDIGNRFVSSGDPSEFDHAYEALSHADPGTVADALVSPGSTLGRAMDAPAFIAEANFITAAICACDARRAPLGLADAWRASRGVGACLDGTDRMRPRHDA